MADRAWNSSSPPGWMPVIRSSAGTVSLGQLQQQAGSLANSLPAAPAALNLCERRENFLVGFLALLTRGQVCLLPPSRAPSVVAEVMQEHPGCYVIDDAAVDRARATGPAIAGRLPDIPPGRVVVVGYTSGSTGRPRANPKTWGGFLASTAFNSARLREVVGGGPQGGHPWIVATVPPQHMYGMEMAVLLPLLAGMGIHGAHPLYPADIAAALEELPVPRVLVIDARAPACAARVPDRPATSGGGRLRDRAARAATGRGAGDSASTPCCWSSSVRRRPA